MAETPPKKPARLRPWLRIVFGLSLAMNLAVVGLAAGAYFRFDRYEGGPRALPIGAQLFHTLPRADQRILRKAAMGSRADHAERRRADADALAAAMQAVPFDAARVDGLLVEHDRALEEFQTSLRAAWLDRVSKMSDADRAAYADRLWHALLGHDRPGAGHDHDKVAREPFKPDRD